MSVSITKVVETDAQLSVILGKLKQEKELGGHVKLDIISHLTEVLSRIMQYHHHDGFDRFEEISIAVKSTSLCKNDPMSEPEINKALANEFKSLS